MERHALAYVLFGLSLVALFIIIIVHYYSKKRHRQVEDAKFKMLEGDD